MPEIGLVGLGRIGVPICANLVRAGYSVRAGDRRPEAAEQAARCGAHWVPQLARLAAGADVLITVLPGAGEVRELMLGAGVAAALRSGTTWIDMTSNSPAAMTEIRNAVLGRGVQVLDAPVGGGVAAAWHGALQLLVGGQRVTNPETSRTGRAPSQPNILACHSGAMCLRLYPEVPVLRTVVVKRVMNGHRVRMLRLRVTEVLSAVVTGAAPSAPCSPVRAGCRGLT